MNIALCHFRVKQKDGVSLEMDKWKAVLQEMGHKVCFIAGNTGKDILTVKGLRYDHKRNTKILKNAFQTFVDYENEKSLENEIFSYASTIEKNLIRLIKTHSIDIIIPSNFLSLGWNIAAGLAIYNACLRTATRVICHHHDFWWERKIYAQPTVSFIQDLLDRYFPPKHKLFKHVVINKIAQNSLKSKKNIDATIIPNVFDFKANKWGIDDFNSDFRQRMGIGKSDLIFLQATRIVERKGVELAIDVVAEINRRKDKIIGKTLYNGRVFSNADKIFLVFSNLNESPAYYNKLLAYASPKKVAILDINSRIAHQRNSEKGQKIYSFWDAYVFADFVTYPSLLEGWGNQFLEGIFAKKPMVVFHYPVYKTDIKPLGFHIVSLGDSYRVKEDELVKIDDEKIHQAVDEIFLYLTDNEYRKEKTKRNFSIATENLSFRTLKQKLSKLL